MNKQSFSLNRRNFIQGAGIALALPWMETFAAKSSTSSNTPKRFFSVYHPDGVGPAPNEPGHIVGHVEDTLGIVAQGGRQNHAW